MTVKALLYLFISMACSAFLSVTSASAEPLHVFAASSLATPLTEIAEAFETLENQDVTLVFASSSLLARQISEGAPADVFVSANQAWMDYLQASGDVEPGSRLNLISNRLLLALIAPPFHDMDAAIPDATPANLLRLINGRRFGMCDPAHVPCGIYGREALESIDLWETLQGSVAYAPDARALVAWLDRGELGGAILYQSDLRLWDADVLTIPIDKAEYGPILYEIAPLRSSTRHAKSVSFAEYVIENTEIFLNYGFTRLAESETGLQ